MHQNFLNGRRRFFRWTILLILLHCTLYLLLDRRSKWSSEREQLFIPGERVRKPTECQDTYNSFHVHERQRDDSNVTCKRMLIEPKDSCELMKRLIKPRKDKCQGKKTFEICSVNETFYKNVLGNRRLKYEFDCTFLRKFCYQSTYGIINGTKGDISWHDLSSDSEIILQSLSEREDFLFIRCKMIIDNAMIFRRKGYVVTRRNTCQQLITFKHRIVKSVSNSTSDLDHNPNLNIIFVDSMSRTEFYYGMEKTSEALRSLSASGIRVLDFKLFQSLSRSSAWHLHNFFTGHINKTNITDYWSRDLDYARNQVDIFRRWKRMGYRTAYSRDMCYAFEYSNGHVLPPNLDRNYKVYRGIREDMEVDDDALNVAVCEISYFYSGNYDNFRPEEKCFNGQHLIRNQIDHLRYAQKFWLSQNEKFVTFLETSINHRHGMMAGKPLDAPLAELLRMSSASSDDTLTILFSDHGNKQAPTYIHGKFPEGYADQHHPMLFIILPKNMEKYFSSEQLDDLERNQYRLTTIRDLHYLLRRFTKTQPPEQDAVSGGILRKIPLNRGCSDLANHTYGNMLDYCICEQKLNESKQEEIEAFTQAAADHMNKLIEKEKQGRHACCRKIHFNVPSKNTVRKTISGNSNSYLYSGVLEISTFAPQGVPVLFEVTASSSYPGTIENFKVLEFGRVDSYSKFKTCALRCGVPVRLCLCEPEEIN